MFLVGGIVQFLHCLTLVVQICSSLQSYSLHYLLPSLCLSVAVVFWFVAFACCVLWTLTLLLALLCYQYSLPWHVWYYLAWLLHFLWSSLLFISRLLFFLPVPFQYPLMLRVPTFHLTGFSSHCTFCSGSQDMHPCAFWWGWQQLWTCVMELMHHGLLTTKQAWGQIFSPALKMARWSSFHL